MAFAGAISSLFDCGRPRKPTTRDGTKPGEDATRSVGATLNHGSDDVPLNDSPHDNATSQLGLGGGQLHISPFAFSPPIDLNPPTDSAATKTNAVRLEHVPEEAPEGRTKPTLVSDQRPSKPGKGTQIEKRILVTADAPDSGLAAFDLDLPNLGNTPVEVTPVVKAPQTTQSQTEDANEIPRQQVEQEEPVADPAPPTEAIESKLEHVEETTSEAAKAFPFKVDEPEVEDVEIESSIAVEPSAVASSELKAEDVEEVVISHTTTESNLLEVPVVPMSVSISEPREDTAIVEIPAVHSTAPEIVTAAPTQLLDLPTEVRKLIYSHMTEDTPIRMIRHDDPALSRSSALSPKRQFHSLTQTCHLLRSEFLPFYSARTEYIIDLWTQRANLPDISFLKGRVSIDIDAACFDMQPIDLLPLIRFLSRSKKEGVRFASTEGVVFRSIESIVEQLNTLLPSPSGSNAHWLQAVNGPMKRVDLHLFPHEDIRAYYRFRGAEPMLRIVYPARVTQEWMKQSHKVGDEYENYLKESGLEKLEMHVVVGHASRRKINEGRMPLDWRLSYVGSRLSMDQAVRISGQYSRGSIDVAGRPSGQWAR